MAQRIGNLIVTIGADVSGIRRGTQQAVGHLSTIENRTRQLTNVLKALAGAFVIRQIGRFVADGLRAVDAMAKLARQLDGTVDGLQSLRIAAQDAGVSEEELTSSLEQLNVRLGQAERGAGTAVDALRALGLEAEDLGNMDLDVRVAAIADAIAAAGLSSAQAADLLRQLGIRSGEMGNLMRIGGDSIRAAREELEAYGLSISDIDAARVEAANDEMERLGRVMQGVRNQVAIGVAPLLGQVALALNEVAKQHGGWADVASRATTGIVRGLGYIIEGFGHLVNFVEQVPSTVGLGLLGKLLFGNKGLVVFGTIGAIVDRLIGDAVGEVDAQISQLSGRLDTLIDQRNLLRGAGMEGPIGVLGIGTLTEVEANLQAVNNQLLELTRRRDAMLAEDAGQFDFGEFLVDTGQAFQDVDLSFLGDIATLAPPAAAAIAELNDELTDPPDPDAYIEALQKRLEGTMQYLASAFEANQTAAEAERAAFTEHLFILDAAFNEELLTREQHAAAVEALEQTHQQNMANIRRMATISTLNEVGGMLGAIGDALEAGGEKNFRIAKAFKIAEALINAGAAIMQTWADPSLPFLAKIVATAAVAARTIATISQMRSVQPGSGGTVTAGGGGGAASGGAAPAPVAHQLYITGLNRTDLFSGGAVIQIIDEINKLQKDGKRIDIMHGSRAA